jgi:hypothetical protein
LRWDGASPSCSAAVSPTDHGRRKQSGGGLRHRGRALPPRVRTLTLALGSGRPHRPGDPLVPSGAPESGASAHRARHLHPLSAAPRRPGSPPRCRRGSRAFSRSLCGLTPDRS